MGDHLQDTGRSRYFAMAMQDKKLKVQETHELPRKSFLVLDVGRQARLA